VAEGLGKITSEARTKISNGLKFPNMVVSALAAWSQYRSIPSRVLGVAAFLSLPAVCFRLTPNTMTLAGYIDPFFYTAYMVNLRSLVERYDTTYYMVRMAAILPGRGIYHLFGPETGFFILHYLQVLIGCTSIFLIARRFYGVWVAWFCVFLLCFSPWYLRSNTWDYVDGFALNYLLAGLAFILVPCTRPIIWYGCGGACFALATNSNLYAVAIWGAFLPSWLLITGFSPVRRLSEKLLAFSFGFAVAYTGLAIAVNLARPGLGPFFEVATLKLAHYLLTGGSGAWFQPLEHFIADGNYYVLTPAAIAIGGVLFVARTFASRERSEKARLTGSFALYLVAVIAIYLINHYYFNSPRITLPYYFCYLVIPSYLMIMALVGQLYEAAPRAARFILTAAIVAELVLWRAYSVNRAYDEIPYTVFILLFVLFIASLTLRIRYAAIALACLLAFTVTIPGLFFRVSYYGELESKDGSIDGHDAFSGALEFTNQIEKVAPPSLGSLAFWFAQEPYNHWILGSVQSIYLYRGRPSIEPPIVNDALRTELAQKKALVILGLTPDEVSYLLSALHYGGIRTHTLAASVYSGHVRSYAYAIVQILSVAR
jgi:hypothetical protein